MDLVLDVALGKTGRREVLEEVEQILLVPSLARNVRVVRRQ